MVPFPVLSYSLLCCSLAQVFFYIGQTAYETRDACPISVEVLLYISINKNSDIISAGVMLQDAREARFNEGFPIFCITSHLKLLEDIGNKFNLIINLNVTIQKVKVKHIHQMKLTCIECHLVKGSSWFLHIYLNKMMDPSTSQM
ncbi:hypothetical protein ACJX0J_024706 [Zea mays]